MSETGPPEREGSFSPEPDPSKQIKVTNNYKRHARGKDAESNGGQKQTNKKTKQQTGWIIFDELNPTSHR